MKVTTQLTGLTRCDKCRSTYYNDVVHSCLGTVEDKLQKLEERLADAETKANLAEAMAKRLRQDNMSFTLEAALTELAAVLDIDPPTSFDVCLGVLKKREETRKKALADCAMLEHKLSIAREALTAAVRGID